ncbi:hypothetical protein QYE76_064406 [Lolium multiflorum]|uniref:non-specific serine/threonine protein kinase n=1 Tax=Lolium multiflorum TaxID=4521 RepID=A0AAD8S855_LOLMU|nr:hypothetical protein QYE76_064406 [Lolium multiflorum]
MDLMKTVYVTINEEKPEPPVCLCLGLKRGAMEIKQQPFSEGVNWDLIHCSTPPEVPRPVEAELPMKYMMPVAIANNSKRVVGA